MAMIKDNGTMKPAVASKSDPKDEIMLHKIHTTLCEENRRGIRYVFGSIDIDAINPGDRACRWVVHAGRSCLFIQVLFP
jgi:hypothetical protein